MPARKNITQLRTQLKRSHGVWLGVVVTDNPVLTACASVGGTRADDHLSSAFAKVHMT